VRYDYPGNVREPENIVERAVVITRDEVISIHDLPFQECADLEDSGEASRTGTLHAALEELERRMIREAMEHARLNQSQAVRQLGLSERLLRYKLKKYGLK
jgi:DNA-binding NtrC family response regulator